MSETISDYDYDPACDFEEALDQAESNARSGWEQEFVESLREKYDEWDERCYLSDLQYEKLMGIVTR